MEDLILTKELLKRIFGNLGAVQGHNFGKVGITTKDYVINKLVKLEYEEGTEEYLVWAGELNAGDVKYKIILTNIGTVDGPEFCAILSADGANPIAFNDNVFVMKNEDKWVGMSLIYKLNLTTAIEMITQEGKVWLPCKDFDYIYGLLVEFLDLSAST